jgi:predicted TIM-barrel fold metal-dependent hydrolase
VEFERDPLPLAGRCEHKKLLGDYASIMRNYMPDDCRHDFAAPNFIKSVHVEAECFHNTQVAETA